MIAASQAGDLYPLCWRVKSPDAIVPGFVAKHIDLQFADVHARLRLPLAAAIYSDSSNPLAHAWAVCTWGA